MTFVAHIRAQFEPLRSVAFGSVGATYAALGTALSSPASALYIRSTLNQDALISLDGVADHLYVGAGASLAIDFGSNKQGTTLLALPRLTQLYQKQGAGGASSSGALYLMVLYGER